jgi:membrane protease YdiL (CAAX protease family)
MSIIGQQQQTTTTTTRPPSPVPPGPAESESPYPLLVVFVPLALIAAALARHIGVFRRRSVDGPPRVDERESLAVLLGLAGTIVFLWLIGQMAVAGLASKRPPAATMPTTSAPAVEFTPDGLAFILIAPPLIALTLGVAGHAATRPGGPRLLGLGLSQLPGGFVRGLVGSAIMIPLVYLVAQVSEIFWRALNLQHATSHELLYKMRDAPNAAVRMALIAAAVVVAPLWEEFIFRGHLQTLLTYLPSRARRRLAGVPAQRGFDVIVPGGALSPDLPPVPPTTVPSVAARWGSIGVTSVCFAAIHYQPGPFPYWMMPPIFVLSLCVGYAYERTGNLWTTITMHASFNAVSTVLYFAVAR